MTSREWRGAYVPYDILKEAFVALLAVAVLIVLMAVVFSSPDEPAITLKSWSIANPVDFAQTSITELDGTSGTAGYGPPYNATPDSSQHMGFFEPDQWFGVHQPIDTAQDFVIGPLRTLPHSPATQSALDTYQSAPAAQQQAWTTAYEKAVANATEVNGRLHVPSGHYGPVGVIVGSLTDMAQTGGLDGTLLSQGQFYNTNYTKPLLFLADGSYMADRADGPAPLGIAVGNDERDGELPRPSVALALHDVVPGGTDEHLFQRRPRGVGDHDGAVAGTDPPPIHPRAALHPPLDPRLPAHLAHALPRTCRRLSEVLSD